MESVYADMSESEKEVAAYLKELGLWWIFESPIFVYDEKGRPRVWTPDFYVPKLGMHIEVCGSEKSTTNTETAHTKTTDTTSSSSTPTNIRRNGKNT